MRNGHLDREAFPCPVRSIVPVALSNVRSGRPPTVTDAMCSPPGGGAAARAMLRRSARTSIVALTEWACESIVYESGPKLVGSRLTAIRLPGASQARGVA